MPDCLRIRPLFAAPEVRVLDVRCRVSEAGCGAEEETDASEIVFLRAGSFAKHLGRRRFFLDPNQAVFFNQSEPYCVSHPVSKGDDCTVFRFAPQTLLESMRESFPGFKPSAGRPFPFSHCPIPASLSLAVQRLRSQIVRAAEESLAIEERAMQILRAVAEAAETWRGRPPVRGTEKTMRAHRDLVDAVRALLAGRYDEKLSLRAISRAVGCSPYHLARIFQSHAGFPMHQYRNQLRLRAALDRIWQGEEDLTQMALSLGYSSHSHFTDCFRRAFGKPPSDYRRSLTRQRLKEMRKILEA